MLVLVLVDEPDLVNLLLLGLLVLLAGNVLEEDPLVLLFQLLKTCLQRLILSLHLPDENVMTLIGRLQLVGILLANHLQLLHFQLPLI